MRRFLPKFPLGSRREESFAGSFRLTQCRPELNLQGLALGIDNLRHDVWLSGRFTESARLLMARLLARYGNVEDLVNERAAPVRAPSLIVSTRQRNASPEAKPADAADCKQLLTEMLREALNRAKDAQNASVDLLARVAVLKFLRGEMQAQFAAMVERCRERLRQYDATHIDPARRAQVHERFGMLQAGKRAVLRKCGEDLYQMLRDVEKETLARTRRSILAAAQQEEYELFLNRLALIEDSTDDQLMAEHYCMLGHYERDPDRYSGMRELALSFLRGATGCSDHASLTAMLAAPENARTLFGDDLENAGADASQHRAALSAWQEMLEAEDALGFIIAAYNTPALLARYAFLNPQQLKYALADAEENRRVQTLLGERDCDPGPLRDAAQQVRRCRGGERGRTAARFMTDLMRYCRDLARLEALERVMERVNVVGTDRLRELSAINSTLYEYLTLEERKQRERHGASHVSGHVILKADVRDSTRLTRTLTERGLNPASYFSLNFYDPVTRLLASYGAEKVFIEGDAMILALLESETSSELAVARTCALAGEMLRIVRAYNERLREGDLPPLEIGIGIAYEPAPPLYLMDGSHRIMISPALNHADRLSSCSKQARELLRPARMFHVHAGIGSDDDAVLCYNVNGIQLSESAFQKLASELTLEQHELSRDGSSRLFAGAAPVNGSFRQIIIRQGQAVRVGGNQPSGISYFEVCTEPEVQRLISSKEMSASAD
jgi:class 3 adenylate cyclase